MKRVTMGDIGEKLGFSKTTISLALRNHHSIPESTKEKVRQMAAEMGFRPDPALGVLNAYRQSKQAPHYQATLAWVHPCPPLLRPRELPWFEPACSHAAILGFRLERFWVATYDDWMRLARMLKARNIQGLIRMPPTVKDSYCGNYDPSHDWAPQNCATKPWRDFPWEDFSAISLGRHPGPNHHQVEHRQIQGVGLAVSKLAELGYRKIGIVLHSIIEWHNDYYWIAGYLAKCIELGLTPYYLADAHPYTDPRYAECVAEWLLRHQPDAVIAPGNDDILPALRLLKWKTPDDIAVAFLCVMRDYPEMAAINQNYDRMGQVAVNQLVDMIRRNERGIPDSNLRYLVEGTWQPGFSAPPVSAFPPPKASLLSAALDHRSPVL